MILGVTLARGGSKGVHKKNIAPCAGKPLLAWTIEAAQAAKRLDRYLVNTEDDAVAAVAKEYGAEVMIRPGELAHDYTNRFEVIQSIAQHFEGEIEALVMLQATSPIRKPGMIDSCIREFQQRGYDILTTGYLETIEGPWRKTPHYGKHRQETVPWFYDDGSVTIWKADNVLRGEEYGPHRGQKIITKAENLDINDEMDLFLAGKLIEGGFNE